MAATETLDMIFSFNGTPLAMSVEPVPEAVAQVDGALIELFELPQQMSGFPMSDVWMVDEGFAFTAMDIVAGETASRLEEMRAAAEKRSIEKPKSPGYVVKDGVAYLGIQGMMTKQPQCMSELFGGGTSTVMTRRALRTAMHDKAVKSAMLMIDSPGGEVDGAFDLSDDVWNLQQTTGKPIDSYLQDNACSAAYLAASQSRKVYGNQNVNAGNIGVYTVKVDSSKALAEKGSKVYVVKSGKFKAIGAKGAPITEDELDHVQGRVNAVQGLFARAVERGRKLGADRLAPLMDAGVFVGQEAVDAGLVDQIATLDAAHADVIRSHSATPGALRAAGPGKDESAMISRNRVKSWLAEHVGGRTAQPQPEPEHSQPALAEMSDEALCALEALETAGVTTAAGVADLVAMAAVGEEARTELVEAVKARAVQAFGAGTPLAEDTALAGVPYSALKQLADSYLAIAVEKGAVPGAPQGNLRRSAAGGPALLLVDPYGPAAGDKRYGEVSPSQPVGEVAPKPTPEETAAAARADLLADSKLNSAYASL